MKSLALPEFGAPSSAVADRCEFLTRDRRADWDAFVGAHRDGTFFHLSGWADVIRQAFGHRSHYLLCHGRGGIRGVLPLVEVRSLLFGHALVSTPFCVYGGSLAEDDAAAGALEAAAIELARSLGVDYLEMRYRSARHPDWPSRDLYVTFRRPLSGDADENLKAIPRRQRAMIRKGQKNGLTAHFEDAIDDHYSMYSHSLRNLGTPIFAKRYLRLLKEIFGAQCETCTVRYRGSPVASVLSFYFKNEVLPYYGGGSQAARDLAANDFMYWEVMERARQKGATLFDYGRSKKGTGSYDFKKYWGFEPQQMSYEYWLGRAQEPPNLSPSNPRYRALITAWRHLPLGLTRFLGPPIAKYLG